MRDTQIEVDADKFVYVCVQICVFLAKRVRESDRRRVRVSGWAVFEMDCDREIVTKLMLKKIEVEDEEVRKTKCR